MKQLQNSPFSSVEEKKSFDENSSQELSLESLSEISGTGPEPITRGGYMRMERIVGWRMEGYM